MMVNTNRQFSTLQKVLFVAAAVLSLSSFVSSPIALVGGFLFAYLIGNPFHELSHKAVNWLLKIAVVGLGFGMNMQEALNASQDGFVMIIFSIFLTLAFGLLIGKFLKLNHKTSYLISSGTAICGGSAIAAVSPIIKATTKDMSIALGVVFLLNSIALLLFPPIGHLLNLSQHQFGLWSAIAIHDTSSVVGAAYAYGNEALQVATTVKLARALWIIPVSIVTMFFFKGKSSTIKIPWFIFLFIAAVILNSYLSIPIQLTGFVYAGSKSLLVLTLFLIGAGLSVEKIKSAGWKPVMLGLSLWIGVSTISLIAIKLL